VLDRLNVGVGEILLLLFLNVLVGFAQIHNRCLLNCLNDQVESESLTKHTNYLFLIQTKAIYYIKTRVGMDAINFS
jgi:hypothetical protein